MNADIEFEEKVETPFEIEEENYFSGIKGAPEIEFVKPSENPIESNEKKDEVDDDSDNKEEVEQKRIQETAKVKPETQQRQQPQQKQEDIDINIKVARALFSEYHKVSEFEEPFDQAYEEVYKKHEAGGKDGFMKFLREREDAIYEEGARAVLADKEIELLFQHKRKGGSVQSFYETYYNDGGLSSISDKDLYRKHLIDNEGFTEDEADDEIFRDERDGVLKRKADKIRGRLQESINKQKEQALQEYKKREAEAIEQQKNYQKAVWEGLRGVSEVNGIKVPKDFAEKAFRFSFETDENGTAKIMNVLSDRNKYLMINLLEQYGWDIEKIVANKIKEAKKQGQREFYDLLNTPEVKQKEKRESNILDRVFGN